MLPKKNRVDKKLVGKIFQDGSFVGSHLLSLKYYLDKHRVAPRVSFITPKAVSKSAVTRNLLRRRGYGALKKYFYRLPFGFTGVFIFKEGSLLSFGGKKNKTKNPSLLLEKEIKNILEKKLKY